MSRCISSQEQDDVRAVKKAVLNELKRMKEENPELAQFVEAYLVIGVYCMWNQPEAME